MIVEGICNVLVFLLRGVIAIFPTIPKVDTTNLDYVFQALSLADRFVSLKVLSTCLVVLFIVSNAQLLWGVIMWVVRKIPGLS